MAPFYGPLILIKSGFKFDNVTHAQNAVLISLPEAVVMWVGNVICALFVDSIGRRTIFLRAMPIAGLGWILASVGLDLILNPDKTTLVGTTYAYSGILFYKSAFSTVVLIPWL